MLSGFHALSLDNFARFMLEIEKASILRLSETYSRMALPLYDKWGHCHAFGL